MYSGTPVTTNHGTDVGWSVLPGWLKIRPFGRVRGEFAIWYPLSQWSRSGYRGGHVSEGQLMEIKEETIWDLGNLVVVAEWSRN
jgi:hypothetical protein